MEIMDTRAVKRRKHDLKEFSDTEEIREEKTLSVYFKVSKKSSRSCLQKNSKESTDEGRKQVNMSKLCRTFYDKPTVILAKELLGKLIYRVLDDGQVLCGRIVETEGYLGEIDKSCHSYGGKRTKRNEPMFMVPGTAYVYFIYGMYYCLNISSQESGACVLIRSLEPLQGRS